MSRVTLVAVNPRNPADGALQELRWCHNARTRARFLGQDWAPQIVSLPESELDLGFDGAKFGQGATPQIGQLRVAIGRTDSWAALVWKGAFGSLRSASLPAGEQDPVDGAFAIDLLFRVESLSVDEGIATFTLIDLGADLRRPLITRKFGTTGNALLDGAGTIDRKGQVVPTGWGRLRCVPGLLVDRVNNIWLFLDRPAASVQGFFDGGAAFTTGVARASLAALQAASPAAGAVDYCLDAGGLTLARPWTDPTYPFTADLTASGADAGGNIAQAIVAGRTGLAFAAGTVGAFNTLYPGLCGLYVDDERTIATALDELIVRLGGYWRLSGVGEIVLGRLAPAAPAKTFGQTDVFTIARKSIVMPTRRRAVGYARNNRVHNEGEIASILLADNIAGLGDLATQNDVDFGSQVVGATKPADNATRNVDRGAWVSAAVGASFVVGDEVQDQGSSWGCILAHSKTALNGPPTLPTASNSTWRLRSAKGDSGASSAIVFIYARATTAPAAPSASATYTFATGGLTGLNNGWTPTIPSGTNPIYVRQATASAAAPTATIAPADWSAAQVLAQNGAAGAAGARTAVVFIYQRAAAAPAAPSATATFTFASGAIAGLNNGWSGTIPAANGQPLWVRTAIASGTGATDTIASGEWTGSQILAEDGADALIVTSDIYAAAIPCDAGGVPLSGALPITVSMQAALGNTDVTGSTTWGPPSMTGCLVTSLGGGQYRIDAVGADIGRFVITATYEGRSQNVAVTFAKLPAGRAAVSIRDDTLVQATSASWITASDIFILPFGPGQTLNLAVSGAYGIAGAPPQGAQGRIIARLMFRNVTDGGAWTQAGAEIDGSFAVANYIVFPIEPQHVPGTIAGARTGPVAPSTLKVFEVRLDLRLAGVAVTQGLAFTASIT